MRHPLVTMIMAFSAYGALTGVSLAEVDNYEDCLSLVAADPAGAEVQALRWFDRTGEPGALHCEAVALAARGAHGPAAQRFASLANSEAMDAETRAYLMLQSAEEWKALGELIKAQEAIEQGLKIYESADLLVERALIRLNENQGQAARYDIDRALTLRPSDPELMTLRAAIKRRLGDRQGARVDAAEATLLAPDHADAWLELGLAEQALGREDLAREAWLTAISADPESPAASAARGALQDMDGG